MQKYLKTKQFKFGKKSFTLPVEALSYGLGLFGIALISGWVPEYAKTYFADFAFKGRGFDSDKVSAMIASLFLAAGFVGAFSELIIGFLVDKTKSKRGKIQPWLLYGALPLAVVSLLVFLAPKIDSFFLSMAWMFVVYCLYVACSVAIESPSNCFGAVCTPNPDERSDAISVAGILRSVGQSGGMVVLIVVGVIMKAIMGEEGFRAAEGRGLDLQISTAVCVVGFILFLSVMLKNTKERVPYTNEKVNLLQSVRFVFTNKNLLMVSLAKVAGFGRGVYSAVSLYIAIYLLGDKGLKLGLLLPMGIGTAVSMLVVKKLIKTMGSKKTFIGCSLYGATSFVLLFIVSRVIGFRKELIIPFLIINFLVGLQNGNTNLTPNVMIADCVDEIEWKTGKRQEGLCYAGYGLFSKIASAFTSSLGTYFVLTWSGYVKSADAGIAYAPQSESTLIRFLIIYTIIPACFVLLQILPILFYDLSPKKKEKISLELIERRGVLDK